MLNQHFTVIGLTNDQVAHGMLSAIGDVVRNRFTQSAQQAMANRHIRHQEAWATILFDNPFDFNAPRPYDADSVLYLNDVAKQVVEEAGFVLNVLGELNEAPENPGTMLNMPVFVPA